jgi:hypothetical protein
LLFLISWKYYVKHAFYDAPDKWNNQQGIQKAKENVPVCGTSGKGIPQNGAHPAFPILFVLFSDNQTKHG